MGNARALLAGAAVALLCSAIPSKASAARRIDSPFGASTPVIAYMGLEEQSNLQIVGWKRRSDGACRSTIIGNLNGLYEDTVVMGSSGNDDIRVLTGSDFPTSHCNFRLFGVIYGGHSLDLHGAAGNDHLSAYSGDTWLIGGTGADFLMTSGPGHLYGEDGNDTLLQKSTIFRSEHLDGGPGNDCLEDRNGGAQRVDCGSGFLDFLAIASSEPMSVNCEFRIQGNCP